VVPIPVSIAEFLHASDRVETSERKSLNGFNGLHGGLAVAMLVHKMRTMVPAQLELVAVTSRFLRPLAWPIVVDAFVVKNGASVTIARASASSSAGVSVEATATFGSAKPMGIPRLAPEMPTGIVSRCEAPEFVIPPEFVPISQRLVIRAATDELPYSGSAEPVLCGWVRLRDHVPATDERIVILVDSLAPSYTALLAELKAVPTVEMSVQLSAGAAEVVFDWVLIRARTTSADVHGFVRETIDMWTEAGEYLASCTQLRVVR
jgi:hypothetical protein